MLHRSQLSSLAVLLGCLAVVVGSAGVARAYEPTGQDWTYMASPMGEAFVVCEDTSDTTGELAAIQAAARTWNAVTPRFAFTFGGGQCSAAPSKDGINQIRWSYSPSSSIALAETTWWYDKNTGEISEVDCVFNDFRTWSTANPTPVTRYDVESIMLHEFGHYLSLDHEIPPAVMQLLILPGTQLRVLTADDRNGVRAIYGGDMPPGGIPVAGRAAIVGTESGWDEVSMQKDNGNQWIITCRQNWARWGQIKAKLVFGQKEILREVAFKTDLVDWADNDFEARVIYTDGTSEAWHGVARGYDSLADSYISSTKKVDAVEISEGQFGWFQMKMDYVHAVKR